MSRRVSDEECIAAYERYGHLGQAAGELGIQKATLHGRLVKLGISTVRARPWSVADDEMLRSQYAEYRRDGRVRGLAELLDRTVSAVTSRAYSLGLTPALLTREGSGLSEREVFERSGRDVGIAMSLLSALNVKAFDDEPVPDHGFVVAQDGDPMSKARARFARHGRPYTPASVVAAQARLASLLRSRSQRFNGNVAVVGVFVRASAQRIDVDNMLKLVLDAGTEAELWQDDSQVTAIAGLIEFDPFDPRAIVGVATHESTLKRGSDHWPLCETCGDAFNPAGRKNPRFCSRACLRNRPEGVAYQVSRG